MVPSWGAIRRIRSRPARRPTGAPPACRHYRSPAGIQRQFTRGDHPHPRPLWTAHSLGKEGTSGGPSVQSVINRVRAAAKPGEIMLTHLGSDPDDGTTLDESALPAIIDGLRARGYGFGTLHAPTG